MPPEDQRQADRGDPRISTGYEYWMNIHFPGLRSGCCPELDETYAAQARSRSTATAICSSSSTPPPSCTPRGPPLRIERGKREDDLQLRRSAGADLARRLFLLERRRRRTASASCCAPRTRPSGRWPTSASSRRAPRSCPVDHESKRRRGGELARASGAVGVLIGDEVLDKRGDALAQALREAGLATKIWPFSEVFALPDLDVEQERAAAARPARQPGRAGVAHLHLAARPASPRA